MEIDKVVSYSISTSNHNCPLCDQPLQMLYLIPFLHQTTTTYDDDTADKLVVSYSISTSNHNLTYDNEHLPLVVSYSISTSNHNKNTRNHVSRNVVSYSISTSNHNIIGIKFYVYPVVSYSISTSNHNISRASIKRDLLYLIPFLHQTTTLRQF